MNLGKFICLSSTLIALIMSLFGTVNLLYAVITMLMAIFLSLEDKREVNIFLRKSEQD